MYATATSAASSSIASSKRSSGMVASPASGTWTTRRPPDPRGGAILAHVRDLEAGEDDLRPPALEAQAAHDGRDARRERGRDGHLVGVGVHEPGEARARRLGALDPVLPGRALLLPVAQGVGVGLPDGVRERPPRGRVDVDLP